DELELRIVAQRRRREALDPGKQCRVPARIDVPEPGFGDQLTGLGMETPVERVFDRLFVGAVVAMPGKRPQVERGGQTRVAVLELDPQQLGEEMVEAVPLAPVV